MTSRSWVSMAKATRTASPFQQPISKPSDAQRRLEAGATTAPSCARPIRRPVQGCSSKEAWRMSRKTRFRLTGGPPAPRLALFSRAATRR
jgi:hypothetical protein